MRPCEFRGLASKSNQAFEELQHLLIHLTFYLCSCGQQQQPHNHTWEANITELKHRLGHVASLDGDLPAAAVRLHLFLRHAGHRGRLHVEVLFEARQPIQLRGRRGSVRFARRRERPRPAPERPLAGWNTSGSTVSQLASATGHGQGLGFRAQAWTGQLPAAVAVGARVRSAAVVAAHGGGRRRRGARLGFSRGWYGKRRPVGFGWCVARWSLFRRFQEQATLQEVKFVIRIEASELDGGERRRVASKRSSRDEVLKTFLTKLRQHSC